MNFRVLGIGTCALLAFTGCEESNTVVEAPVAEHAASDAEQVAEQKVEEPATEEVVAGIGTVDAVRGAVTVERAGEKSPIEQGKSVLVGDVIETGDNGKVRLALSGETVLALGAKSRLTLAALEIADGGRKGTFKIAVGKFWAQIGKWTGTGESYLAFHTPNAVAGVRGTTLWGDVERDTICALEGSIEVVSTKAKKRKKRKKKANKPKVVKAGKCVTKLSKGKTKALKPKAKDVKLYLAEVLITDEAE